MAAGILLIGLAGIALLAYYKISMDVERERRGILNALRNAAKPLSMQEIQQIADCDATFLCQYLYLLLTDDCVTVDRSRPYRLDTTPRYVLTGKGRLLVQVACSTTAS